MAYRYLPLQGNLIPLASGTPVPTCAQNYKRYAHIHIIKTIYKIYKQTKALSNLQESFQIMKLEQVLVVCHCSPSTLEAQTGGVLKIQG